MLIAVRWAALIVLLAPAGLAGCSLGGDKEPQPARGAVRDVAAVVHELELATRDRDFRLVCDDLFTSTARRRSGGRDCPRLLRSNAAGLRGPRIQILGIEIDGDRARARVRSRAAGQPSLVDTIDLVRGRDGYRIAALAD